MVNSLEVDEEFKRLVDATHESGHAIVGTAMGRRVTRVELIHDESTTVRGQCSYADENIEDAIKGGISVVVSGLAGPLAAFKRYGRFRPYQTDEELAQLTKPDSDTAGWGKLSADFRLHAFAICDHLLDLYWPNVLGLAGEVVARGVVTASSWLEYIPSWWDFPVLADRREIVLHLADGDVSRIVNTHPE